MKGRIIAVIVSGILCVMSCLAFVSSWHTYRQHGSRFLSTVSGPHVSTTFSILGGLGAGALFFGVCFVGDLFTLLSPRNTRDP
jgi:hypothetical protein